MNLTRRSKVIAALITLVSLLFTQLAVAAYTCPELTAATAFEVKQVAHASTPGCHGMDKKQPNLCDAHASVGKQSLDKPDLPQIPAFVAIDLLMILSVHDAQNEQFFALANTDFIPHASAPPLSIRNCCFRL